MAVEKIALKHGYFATIDESDLIHVTGKKWRVSFCKSGLKYAVTGRRQVAMHRLIMGAKKGEIVDHINGDTLDNRRSNLRKCTHTENMRNRKPQGGTSKFKGVWTSNGRWHAGITVSGVSKKLGVFKTEIDAALAYDAAAKSAFGAFAKTNSDFGLY